MTLLDWAKLAALISAGAFFVFKVLHGWLMMNVSLDGSTARRSRGDGEDDLAVCVKISKGGNGSVRIHDSPVRATWEGGKTETAHLYGPHRLAHTPTPPFAVLEPWRSDPRLGPYRLPPGEGTIWSCLLKVPNGQPCIVEAVVLGQQWPNRRLGQWTFTSVSLPEESRPNRSN